MPTSGEEPCAAAVTVGFRMQILIVYGQDSLAVY